MKISDNKKESLLKMIVMMTANIYDDYHNKYENNDDDIVYVDIDAFER